MIARRTMLKWTATAAAGLLAPVIHRGGRSWAAVSGKSGRFFGYQPFTQDLFIPDVLTPLTGRARLYPVPGAYARVGGPGGGPDTPTGSFAAVAHGIAPEFGLCSEWNCRRSGYSAGHTHEQEFELVTEETTHRFVPGGPDTPVFTYRDGTKSQGSGSTPGPTIVAEYLEPGVLRDCNALTRSRLGANSTLHDVETAIHLHGSHVPAHADGFPDFYCLAGEARDYFYPNIAPKVTDPHTLKAPVHGGEFDTTWIPSTLWYHDHAMDITGFNVTRGLAGFYLIFDDRQRELADQGVIPPIGGRDAFGNPLDIGLALQDQCFNADGTLFYDFLDHNGRLGDVFTVNGVVQPRLKVQRRKYRFRILNASNARVYELRLSTRHKFAIIGTDSWLLPRAIEVSNFELVQGQRQDVVIDFRDAPDEVYLENIMAQTKGRKPDGIDPARRIMLMKFEVSGPNSSEPATAEGTVIRGFAGIDPGGQFSFHRPEEVVATRRFRFDRFNGAWTVNGQLFNSRRADAVPALGLGAERWILANESGGWWHPFHPHLEGCQIRSVNGRPPRRERQFNLDVLSVPGNTVAEVLIKFRTFTGPFVFHCHAVEHEDMRMMAVVDPTPAPGDVSGAVDATGPLDGVTRIAAAVSGVVPTCEELAQEERIFSDAVGDVKRLERRDAGFPDCSFGPGGRRR